MDADSRRKHQQDIEDYWEEETKFMPSGRYPSISPECVPGQAKHKTCHGQAWDLEKEELTVCECLCHEQAAAA